MSFGPRFGNLGSETQRVWAVLSQTFLIQHGGIEKIRASRIRFGLRRNAEIPHNMRD